MSFGAFTSVRIERVTIRGARCRRFVYSAAQYTRLEAWQHLTASPIPGAPHVSNRVPWRKSHDIARGEWAWVYVG